MIFKSLLLIAILTKILQLKYSYPCSYRKHQISIVLTTGLILHSQLLSNSQTH